MDNFIFGSLQLKKTKIQPGFIKHIGFKDEIKEVKTSLIFFSLSSFCIEILYFKSWINP